MAVVPMPFEPEFISFSRASSFPWIPTVSEASTTSCEADARCPYFLIHQPLSYDSVYLTIRLAGPRSSCVYDELFEYTKILLPNKVSSPTSYQCHTRSERLAHRLYACKTLGPYDVSKHIRKVRKHAQLANCSGDKQDITAVIVRAAVQCEIRICWFFS